LIEDHSSGQRDLERLSQPQRDGKRTEFNIHGMRRADLKAFVPEYTDSRISRNCAACACAA
jgi:hypothetical protein